MTDKPTLIENLKQRRVPQYVGMYVAATWLVIELGDWVTERFGFSASVTSYVFVAMVVMLPAVLLFAYNHGAPGKDDWTKSEQVVIPLNSILALTVLYFISPMLYVEAATETVQIPDETGVIREFEVARQGYHKEVLAFFWQNDTGNSELDWLSYGLPLMLAHDLNRVSPVITVETPFDSSGIRNQLKDRGFDSLLDEPQGLRVEIARDRRSAALIVGSFAQVGETMTINVTVNDVETGDEIGSHVVSGGDWLTAIDDVSQAVLNYLEVEASDNQSDDPIGQHFTNSIGAIRHFTNGHLELDINNDYPQGIAEFQSALGLDSSFAEASRALSLTHYLSGDLESARISASEALNNSYRLSETGKFSLKANRYIFDGDYARGERVVDIWSQVQPNSAEALQAMVQIAKIRGGADALDKASSAFDRLLELDPKNFDILREKAELEQQRGDYEAAASYLVNFLEHEPESGDALLQLANIYQAQGDLDAAQSTLEDAAILSDNPLQSEIGLARLEARQGFYDEAEERLAGLRHDALNPQQRVQMLSAQAEVALVRGKIEKTRSLLAEIGEIAKELMPPMVRLINIDRQQANLLILLGKVDEAIAIADEVRAQLQPPIESYLNFNYTEIYEVAQNRTAYREWANKTKQVQDQLPEPFKPIIEMESARVAIWDQEFALAVDHTDRAGELLGHSLIQVLQSNLSTSAIHVKVAELYLDAAAFDKSQEKLEEILQVFPSHAYAKLMSARVQLALGDEVAARELLTEALAVWSEADADYIYLLEATTLLENL